jgi:hypothetical protein
MTCTKYIREVHWALQYTRQTKLNVMSKLGRPNLWLSRKVKSQNCGIGILKKVEQEGYGRAYGMFKRYSIQDRHVFGIRQGLPGPDCRTNVPDP